MNRTLSLKRMLCMIFALAMLATACGADSADSDSTTASDTASSGSTATTDADGNMTGEFLVSGSSTVFRPRLG